MKENVNHKFILIFVLLLAPLAALHADDPILMEFVLE